MTTPTNNPGIDLDKLQRFNNRGGLMNPEASGLYVRLEQVADLARQAAPEAPTLPIYQWRQKPVGSYQPAWYDATKEEAYARVDDYYEARTVYASTGAATEAPATQQHIERDWIEDAPHENGNYQCKCSTCGNTFIGYKRRITCKACAAATQQAGAAKLDLTNYSQAVNYANSTATTVIPPAATTASASECSKCHGSESVSNPAGWQLERIPCPECTDRAPAPGQEAAPLTVPRTYGGFRGWFYVMNLRAPTEQEIFDAGMRAGRDIQWPDRAAQAAHAGADTEQPLYSTRMDAARYRFLEEQCRTGTYRGIISRKAIDAAMSAATNLEPK